MRADRGTCLIAVRPRSRNAASPPVATVLRPPSRAQPAKRRCPARCVALASEEAPRTSFAPCPLSAIGLNTCDSDCADAPRAWQVLAVPTGGRLFEHRIFCRRGQSPASDIPYSPPSAPLRGDRFSRKGRRRCFPKCVSTAPAVIRIPSLAVANRSVRLEQAADHPPPSMPPPPPSKTMSEAICRRGPILDRAAGNARAHQASRPAHCRPQPAGRHQKEKDASFMKRRKAAPTDRSASCITSRHSNSAFRHAAPDNECRKTNLSIMRRPCDTTPRATAPPPIAPTKITPDAPR